MIKPLELIFNAADLNKKHSILIIPKIRNGVKQIPLSVLAQAVDALKTADEGIEVTGVQILFDCHKYKKEDILKNLKKLEDENYVLINFYNLRLEVLCVFYFYWKITRDHQRIADFLGFPKVRTIKTILDYRISHLELDYIEQFEEEMEEHYGDLTHEVVFTMAAIIKEQPKDPSML
jgi:hypothetical protein